MSSYWVWCLYTAVWATICFVIPDFIDNPIGNIRTLLLVVAYIISVGIFQLFLIYIINVNRYVSTIILPLYALIGAVCSYYRAIYHVSITPLLIDATFHTHIREAAGVISLWLMGWVFINVCISIGLVLVRFWKIQYQFSWGKWAIVCLFMFAYYLSIPRLKDALDTRFPLNLVYSLKEYIEEQNRPSVIRECPSISYTNIPDTLIVVAVLGEAARADHLQLNGYERETTPLLRTNPNVVSLPQIYSQYTNTNGSIPHIITRADSIHSEYAYTETSFVTLFKQCGFHTVWLTNKNQNKPFIDFMQESDTIQYTSSALTQSLYAKWLDSDLFPLINSHIGLQSKQLFVLHTMGSHWLYDTHVSDELCIFQPTINNRDIRQNSQERIINSYDNTIVYLDFFIDSLISCLQNYPAIILYLSDHGESLGEGGRYLHSQQNAEEEKNPAAVIWYSDKYKKIFPKKVFSLHKNCQKHYNTDYFFCSILSAADIKVEGYNELIDIFE